ncbi:P-loop NTPase fold protein [Amycolatopsis sp. NPDC049691]|uniref:KAP family P-loop NTPase fold protein n=1 Tax=Amycolatopsis sp. NPDC049691 TaxID=3155155 RepID=UPI00341C0C04
MEDIVTFTDDDLIADEPLNDAADDQLQRGHTVHLLISQITSATKSTASSVIALTGSWGAGKTTVLNLARKRLTQEDKIRVVDFSPWLFSDLASLVSGFFTSLQKVLPQKGFKKTRAKLAKYSAAAAPLGKMPAVIGGPDLSGPLKGVSDILASAGSLESTRNSIDRDLQSLDYKVLIIIDDLDRLHPEELLLVFKLIRSIARFPNVYYVLSFDEHTILDLLSSTDLAQKDRARASAYVEKIVQAKVNIPPLHEAHYEDLFLKGIRSVAKRSNTEIDPSDISNTYQITRRYLAPWLNTPRSIRKLFIDVQQSWAALAGEVNFTDNFLISFLRIYEPALYNALPAYKSRLSGESYWDFTTKNDPEDHKLFWDQQLKLYNVADERAANVLGVLAEMFKSASEAVTGVKQAQSRTDAEQNQRIGSATYFDRYFQVTIPPGDVSDQVVASGLNAYLRNDTSAVDALTLDLLIEESPRVSIRKIGNILRKLNFDDPSILVRRLTSAYRSLDDDRQFLLGSTFDEVEYIIRDVLDRTSPSRLDRILEEIVRPENALLAANQASRGQRAEETPVWLDPLLTKLKDVLESEVNRIGQLDITTLDQEEFRLFLRWGALYGLTEARSRAHEFISSGHWSMRGYLGHLVGERTLYGSNGNTRLVGERTIEELSQFLDVDLAIEELRDHIGEPPVSLSQLTERPSTQKNREEYGLALLALKVARDSQD